MGNTNYKALLTGAVWIEPINPGMHPIIPNGADRLTQENISSQWENEFEARKMMQDVWEALKKQIIDAINDEYDLEDLKDPDTGYTNVELLQTL